MYIIYIKRERERCRARCVGYNTVIGVCKYMTVYMY